MQRKFSRLSEDDKSATYQVFRQWLGSTSITEEEWATILEEDEAFDYLNLGVGREGASEMHVGVGAEEEVQTEDIWEFDGGSGTDADE